MLVGEVLQCLKDGSKSKISIELEKGTRSVIINYARKMKKPSALGKTNKKH